MPVSRAHPSLAVAAMGLFGFAFLTSGSWHLKFPVGGLTQVGRSASITFQDGTELSLDESEVDQTILKRRRMAGWHGHEYRQVFVLSDGREMDVRDPWLGTRLTEASELSDTSLSKPVDLATEPVNPTAAPTDSSDLSSASLQLGATSVSDESLTLPLLRTALVQSADSTFLLASTVLNEPLDGGTNSNDTPAWSAPEFALMDLGNRSQGFYAPSGATVLTVIPEPTTLPMVVVSALLTGLTLARRCQS